MTGSTESYTCNLVHLSDFGRELITDAKNGTASRMAFCDSKHSERRRGRGKGSPTPIISTWCCWKYEERVAEREAAQLRTGVNVEQHS